MNKDVIYIDVEDDVTAIIGKIKDSKEKIVALVPPKRTGVLQSAVNLRIMQRTAKASGKHLVLITNDSSLIPLAAGAGLPVAKNLQSKPEVPEVAALKVDDDDDIIDGSELPIGEHAATASGAAAAEVVTKAPEKSKYATPPKSGESPRKSNVKGSKVPDFNLFRKKLVFIILGVLLLVGFLVWAIFFAPRATVEITAKTSAERISTAVTLGSDVKTDAEAGTLKMLKAEEVAEGSVEFAATGTEEKGERATGTMEITRTAVNNRSISIPVGTGFSSGDYTFTTTESATLSPPEIGGSGLEFDSVEVAVQAVAIGDEYNLSSRKYDSTVNGVEARGSTMSGGSKRTVKIVTQADVQAASEKLAKQNDTEVKAKLEDRFPRNSKIIDSSFRSSAAEVKSTPEVGQEAPDGKASLNSSITYTMNAVATSELDKYIEKAVDMKLSNENEQRVYESGASKATIVEFAATETGATANLTASAQVGPQIDDKDIKNRVAGKKFGDIQSDIESIAGVDQVDVQFFPFWVNTVPEDHKKINIEFNLENSSSNES